jgi:hypothetical protein
MRIGQIGRIRTTPKHADPTTQGAVPPISPTVTLFRHPRVARTANDHLVRPRTVSPPSSGLSSGPGASPTTGRRGSRRSGIRRWVVDGSDDVLSSSGRERGIVGSRDPDVTPCPLVRTRATEAVVVAETAVESVRAGSASEGVVS